MNFRTRRKYYKNKRKIENPKEDWLIFENTHEPIVTQQEFELVQEMRKNKRRNQKQETVNPFLGIYYRLRKEAVSVPSDNHDRRSGTSEMLYSFS